MRTCRKEIISRDNLNNNLYVYEKLQTRVSIFGYIEANDMIFDVVLVA